MVEGLAKRMKLERIRVGLIQKDAAARLGVSKNQLSHYENQYTAIPDVVIAKAAILYGVSTDFLLGLERDKPLHLDGLTDEQQQFIEHCVEYFRTQNEKTRQ